MEDTISAISTPPGEGGIGIVRISGPKAKEILFQIFKPAGSRKPAHRRLHYGKIVSGRETIDEVLVSFHPAPYSYTREDVVEINCHGGSIPLRRILELTLEKGARLAEPGEFTRRAFENGRIDLTQAEAVIDLIVSRTKRSAAAALRQLAGGLKEEIGKLRLQLLDLLAEMEAVIDYPEEDLQVQDEGRLLAELDRVRKEIGKIIAQGEKGRLIREGVDMVIVGRPNAGKSSLLNHLLGRARAIVSDIPGTTRDVLEEDLNIAGIPIRLVDTAGMRESGDVIEMEGVRIARKRADQADFILHIIDGSVPFCQEDRQMASLPQKGLTLINKSDLVQAVDLDDVQKTFPQRPPLSISLVSGHNLDRMEKEIEQQLLGDGIRETEPPLVTNIRHMQLLYRAQDSLQAATAAIKDGMPYDLAAIDLREAWEALGKIIGAGSPEEVIDQIFRRFCLGK